MRVFIDLMKHTSGKFQKVSFRDKVSESFFAAGISIPQKTVGKFILIMLASRQAGSLYSTTVVGCVT
jgi:hypothetical protein